MAVSTDARWRFLDPATVARIASLELRARTVVEGFIQGLHRSPFRGFSVEFAEYRQYMPGDDLSSLDWKVFARSDRHVVKKFEEETNLQCHLLLDVSASMGYEGGGLSKIEYGTTLAACLAYLMTRQRDAVSLTTFSDQIVDRLAASSRPGHVRTVLLALERMRLGKRSNVSKPLHQLAETLARRGVVIVISDLLDDPAAVIRGLKHVRFRGMEVIVFHLLHPDELTFPFERATRFRDLESDQEVTTDPDVVRGRYLEQMGGLIARYTHELKGNGVDYRLVDTSKPLDLALIAYLSARGRAL